MNEFNKQGYYVVLTSYSGDKGADVIARQRRNDTGGLLIQAKHRRQAGGKANKHAVDEILAAKSYYEKEYGTTFQFSAPIRPAVTLVFVFFSHAVIASIAA